MSDPVTAGLEVAKLVIEVGEKVITAAVGHQGDIEVPDTKLVDLTAEGDWAKIKDEVTTSETTAKFTFRKAHRLAVTIGGPRGDALRVATANRALAESQKSYKQFRFWIPFDLDLTLGEATFDGTDYKFIVACSATQGGRQKWNNWNEEASMKFASKKQVLGGAISELQVDFFFHFPGRGWLGAGDANGSILLKGDGSSEITEGAKFIESA